MTAREVIIRVVKRVVAGPVLDLAAQVAFYAVLALAPFLVVLTSLAGFVSDEGAVTRLLMRMRGFMPDEAYALVSRVVQDVVSRRSAALLTFGVLTALWSASRTANAMRLALNDAHQVKDGRPWVRQQLAALVVTLGGAALLLVSVLAAVVGADAIEFASKVFGVELGSQLDVWSALRWPVSVLSLAAVAALTFRVLPDLKARPGPVWLGASVATVLFLISSRIFSFYAANFGNFGVTYGSLTGGVLLLLWAWLSAVSFIVGGEVVAALPGARPRR